MSDAPVFKLGMTSFTPPKLKLKTYFKPAKLPPVPKVVGRPWLIKPGHWGMMANDTVGDCVLAGGAHETMLFNADAQCPVAEFTDQNVLADYSAITGYVPGDENTDQGTDPDAAASYRRKTGLIDASGVRHKIDVYADLKNRDLDQLALAVFLFGVAGIGVNLPQKAMDQFNRFDVWKVALPDRILGGHYIPCVGRNSAGNYLFVTWGRLQAATPSWVRRYMVGGIAYMSRERLNAQGLSPQGYNAAALNDDFNTVTA
jgi:hypothetical protein